MNMQNDVQMMWLSSSINQATSNLLYLQFCLSLPTLQSPLGQKKGLNTLWHWFFNSNKLCTRAIEGKPSQFWQLRTHWYRQWPYISNFWFPVSFQFLFQSLFYLKLKFEWFQCHNFWDHQFQIILYSVCRALFTYLFHDGFLLFISIFELSISSLFQLCFFPFDKVDQPFIFS